MQPYPVQTPQQDACWWQDAVFYHVLVDRFRRAGHNLPLRDPMQPWFCGGDLRGLIEKLDYLRALSITASWLSPIQRTAGYHGYHVTDYDRAEPRFGGMAAFREKSAWPTRRAVPPTQGSRPSWTPTTRGCPRA